MSTCLDEAGARCGRIDAGRFSEGLPFERADSLEDEGQVALDRFEMNSRPARMFETQPMAATQVMPGVFSNGTSAMYKVPLLDSKGNTDYSNQIDVELINMDRLSPVRDAEVSYEDVIKTAASTTVFVGGVKDKSGWSGSGFVVDPRDLPFKTNHYSKGAQFILTNYHVAGDADKLWVVLQDGTELWAEVAETLDGVQMKDEIDDFCLIVIDPGRKLPMARIGGSDDIEQGDEVLVAGYPKGLPALSITRGIISNPEAETGYVAPGLQTDAAINPGNSGGPMFDVKTGKVVGINTYGFRYTDNMGFAQPIDVILGDMSEIGWVGKVFRGYTGVGLSPFPLRDRKPAGFTRANGFSDETGAIVKYVDPDSTAALAGIMEGDVVTSIDVAISGRVIGSYDINFYSWYQIGLMDRMIFDQRPNMEIIYHVYRPKAGGGYEEEKPITVVVDELTIEKYELIRSKLRQEMKKDEAA